MHLAEKKRYSVIISQYIRCKLILNFLVFDKANCINFPLLGPSGQYSQAKVDSDSSAL